MGAFNFKIKAIKDMRTVNQVHEILVDYIQKGGLLVKGWYRVSAPVFHYINLMVRSSSDEDHLFPGIIHASILNNYLSALIQDHCSFKDLKTVIASLHAKDLFESLDIRYYYSIRINLSLFLI